MKLTIFVCPPQQRRLELQLATHLHLYSRVLSHEMMQFNGVQVALRRPRSIILNYQRLDQRMLQA